MKTFIASRTSGENSSDPCINATNRYLEIAYPFDDEDSVHIYIIPRSSTQAFVAVCLDHAFDSLFEDFDEDSMETVAETWPTLAALLVNGVKDRYSEAALIRLEDEDDGESKWFVATVVGNISFDDAENVFTPRTQESIRLIIEKTLSLFQELATREPSMGRAIGKGILEGIGAGVAVGIAAYFGIDLSDA